MNNALKNSNDVIKKVITKIGKLFDLIELLNKSIKGHNVNITQTNEKIKMLINIINRYSEKFVVINKQVENYVNNLKDKKVTIYNDAKELTTNTTELNNIIDNRMEEIGIFSVTPEETGANATANTSQTDANTPEPVYFTYNQLQNIINGIPAPPAPVAPVAQPPPETQQIKLKNAFRIILISWSKRRSFCKSFLVKAWKLNSKSSWKLIIIY
jgi:phage-related tail protein